MSNRIRIAWTLLAALFVLEFGAWVMMQRYQYHQAGLRSDRITGQLEVLAEGRWRQYPK